LTSGAPTWAQRWTRLHAAGETDFRVLSAAFYAERDSLLAALAAHPEARQMPKLSVWEEASKRMRYKQFHRMEDVVAPRMNDAGVYDPLATWAAYAAWHELYGAPVPAANNTTPVAEGNNAAWTPFGPTSTPPIANVPAAIAGTGRASNITFHPTDSNTFYVSAGAGGLWKTTNGGASYTPLTDFGTSIVQAGDLVLDPANPSTLYLATSVPYLFYNGAGIWKSTDGGATWTQSGLSGIRVQHMVMDPADASHLWACTDAGLYQTTNAGGSWAAVPTAVLPIGAVQCLEYQPGNSTNVYLSINISGGTHFYKSTDDGATWTAVTLPQPAANINRIEFAVTPADGQYIYMAAIGNSNAYNAIYKSTDAGATWTTIANPSTAVQYQDGTPAPQNYFDFFVPYTNVVVPISVSPTDKNEVYVGFVFLAQTLDGGATWKDYARAEYGGAANAHHVDHVDTKWNPVTGKLYIACDGGVYRRNGGPGATLSDLNGSLGIVWNYTLETSHDGAKFLTGTQDVGTFLYDGSTWKAVDGGDGTVCHFDAADNNIFYTAPQAGLNIGRISNGAANGGATGGDMNNLLTQGITGQEAAFITQYVLHPVDRSVIYAAYKDVFKTTDGGRTWTNLTNGSVGTNTKRILRISKADPNLLVLAENSTNYWKSTDGGATWLSLTALNGNYYTDICLHPSNAAVMWASQWGSVVHSTNGGSSFSAYSAGSGPGSLPGIRANCLAYQDGTNPVLYVGMDIGVYSRHDTGSGWRLYTSNDLPNVIVQAIEVVPALNKLRVGTMQRGTWQTVLAENYDGCLQTAVPTVSATDCNGTITLTASAPPAGWGHQWYKDGSPVSGATAQTYAVTASGNYAVVFANGTCRSPASITRAFNLSLPALPTVGSGCNALHFDGVNDAVAVKHSTSLALSNDFSIEFWLKMDAPTNTWQHIAYKAFSYGVEVLNNDIRFVTWGDDAVFAGGLKTDGQWHHYALTAAGGNTRKLYVDGVLATTNTGAYTTDQGGRDLELGLGAGANAFSLDEVRIWNYTRSATQIATAKDQSITCRNDSLVLYLPFEEGTAGSNNTALSTAYDYSVHANYGTVQNFARTGATSNWVTGVSRTWYQDSDGDTYGNPSVTTTSCVQPTGYVTRAGDCNDASATAYVGATEICGNGVDDDCDGNTDVEVNKALAFDGSNDKIVVAHDASMMLGNSFTLEFWLKMNAPVNAWQHIAYKPFSYGVEVVNNDILFVTWADDAYFSNGLKTDGQWHHYALTAANGNTRKLYVDGVPVATNTATYTTDQGTSDLEIGPGANGNAFSLDEVRIWNTNRTGDQVKTYMSRRLDGTETGLVRAYSFDQGTAAGNNEAISTAQDRSPNAAHRPLSNFALSGSSSNWVSSWTYPTLYGDADGDGWGNSAAGTWACGSMTPFRANNADCDDASATRRPDKLEVYGNATDENCNGATTDSTNLALHFDGSNDTVNLGTSVGNFDTGDFTIEFWTKVTSGNFVPFLSKRSFCGLTNQWNVFMIGGKVYLEMNNDYSNAQLSETHSQTVITNGEWRHVAITRAGSTVKYYIDGVLDATATGVPVVNLNPDAPLLIGAGTCFNAFAGTMDELRIWTVERTQAEIRAAMNSRLSGTQTGLSAYYSFDHPQATAGGVSNTTYTALYDNTLNHRTGTLTGFGLAAATSNWVAGVPYVRENGASKFVWTGNTSTAWNTATNWSPRVVPSAADNVLIPAGSFPNEPTVNAAGTAAALEHEAGRTLTLGSNTLTLTGAFTNRGTLKGTGTLATTTLTNAASGVIAPGNSPGILTVNGNVAFSGGALNIEVAGNGQPGTPAGYDRLTVNGNVTGLGVLNVDFGTFSPGPADSWQIVQGSGTMSGNFSAINHAPATVTAPLYNGSTGVLFLSTPLPLSLLDFGGQRSPDGMPQLHWRTSAEAGLATFFVQRATDGTRFADAGSLPARNLPSSQSYLFADVAAPAGGLYYRLRVAAVDGTSTFSKTIKLSGDATAALALYPNPVPKGAVLHTGVAASKISSWKLLNGLGQTVRSGGKSTVAGELTIATAGLSAGVYLLQMEIGNTPVSARVVIQ